LLSSNARLPPPRTLRPLRPPRCGRPPWPAAAERPLSSRTRYRCGSQAARATRHAFAGEKPNFSENVAFSSAAARVRRFYPAMSPAARRCMVLARRGFPGAERAEWGVPGNSCSCGARPTRSRHGAAAAIRHAAAGTPKGGSLKGDKWNLHQEAHSFGPSYSGGAGGRHASDASRPPCHSHTKPTRLVRVAGTPPAAPPAAPPPRRSLLVQPAAARQCSLGRRGRLRWSLRPPSPRWRRPAAAAAPPR
jgi:hypothetical protein